MDVQHLFVSETFSFFYSIFGQIFITVYDLILVTGKHYQKCCTLS